MLVFDFLVDFLSFSRLHESFHRENVMCCHRCSGRYYYWNTETDEVSWLSPEHPRAVITLSSERLKGFTLSLIYECFWL